MRIHPRVQRDKAALVLDGQGQKISVRKPPMALQLRAIEHRWINQMKIV